MYDLRWHGSEGIECWGRRITVLALLGWLICCFAATKDGYHLFVQAFFDASIAVGIKCASIYKLPHLNW